MTGLNFVIYLDQCRNI